MQNSSFLLTDTRAVLHHQVEREVFLQPTRTTTTNDLSELSGWNRAVVGGWLWGYDEELAVVFERLAVERVEHGMAGAVLHARAAVRLSKPRAASSQ